jgi:hypothetical protein
MAIPANPLDELINYSYAFELHCADTWEKLAPIADSTLNINTTRTNGVDTLLINTRKDAHQRIDDVRCLFNAAGGYPGFTAGGNYTLTVTEPGGIFFTEKLQNQLLRYGTGSLMDHMTFALKIFFIGRGPNNEIVGKQLSRLFAMQLQDIDADFTYRGGTYIMNFVSCQGANIVDADHPLSKTYGYSDKQIMLKATDLTSAMQQLEDKLNANYQNTYKTDLDNTNKARPVKYTINLDPRISGTMNGVSQESFAPNSDKSYTLPQTMKIEQMINQLISQSTFTQTLGTSQEGLSTQFHTGVKLPIINPRFHLQDDTLEIAYDITLYEGGADNVTKYELDYYFSGKNVDVLEFKLNLKGLAAYIGSSASGVDQHANTTSTMPQFDPQFYGANVVHEDTTRTGITNQKTSNTPIPVIKGGVAPPQATPVYTYKGLVNQPVNAVNAARISFNTQNAATSASSGQTDPIQLNLTIRGHLNLLESCAIYPDSVKESATGIDLVWMKVNIYSFDEFGNKFKFYYTGYYQVISVENSFSGGLFTQNLGLLMTSDGDEDSPAQNGNTSIATPTVNTPQGPAPATTPAVVVPVQPANPNAPNTQIFGSNITAGTVSDKGNSYAVPGTKTTFSAE